MKMIDRFKNGKIVVDATEEVFEWLRDNTKIRWYSGESLNKKYLLNKFLAIRRQKLLSTSFVNDRKLVTAEEFLRKVKEEMEFTKDMLETGMVVEMIDGRKYMVIKGDFKLDCYSDQSFIFINNTGFVIGTEYNDKLKYIGSKSAKFDITKVYKPRISGLNHMLSSKSNIIWQRQEEDANQKIQALKEIGEAKEEIRLAKERIEAAEKCLKECE